MSGILKPFFFGDGELAVISVILGSLVRKICKVQKKNMFPAERSNPLRSSSAYTGVN